MNELRLKKRGFTLVELSIVLVIIGLLIGGILVAKSMVETAKIQNFIRQIQQFDVATSNFRARFKGLPGDSSFLGCRDFGGGNFCDNGSIVESDGQGGGQTSFDGEIGYFWPALQQTGFVYPGRTFTAYTDPASGTPWDFTSNLPNSPMVKGSLDTGIAAMQCGWIYQAGNTTTTSNCWTLLGTTLIPPLKAEMALAIDKKIDDGLPYTGEVQNYPDAIDNGNSDCDNNTGFYDVTNAVGAAAGCAMQIHMLRDEDGPAQ